MIDPTVLRTQMDGYVKRGDLPTLNPRTVLDLLDENAALRAKLEECAADGIRVAFKLSEAESRLAALTAAGEKVVAECSPFDAPALNALKTLLRSDP